MRAQPAFEEPFFLVWASELNDEMCGWRDGKSPRKRPGEYCREPVEKILRDRRYRASRGEQMQARRDAIRTSRARMYR